MEALAANPFHPQFGKRPEYFIGRDYIVRDFLCGLDNPNDPNRVTVVSGIRGSGKTALLTDVRDTLDSKRFAVVDVTAGPHFLQSVLDQLQADSPSAKRHVIGLNAGALGFSVGVATSVKEPEHGFRYHLTSLANELKSDGRGIVFLVDEVHRANDEMRELVITYQHLMRENHDVALLMAGLPQSVSSVLNDKILTFLHRSNRVFLSGVDAMLTEDLFRRVFEKAEVGITEETAAMAAKATCGFPYLIQLLGYYLWKGKGEALSRLDVERALLNSKADLFRNIHALIMRELSAKDQAFLFAMAESGSSVSMAEMAARLQVSSGYAAKYRLRLIESGVVKATGRGIISFDVPYMQEYLLRHSES
ncbi:MAG: ATP-binding protein [Coriobacteriales bacterium]|jgi:hypothetical protein|nr:ATP-binding protein [Coriobacteriales bacterium]